MTFTVDLDLPPKSLSPNVKAANPFVKVRATAAYRRTCGVLFRQAMPRGWNAQAVEIDVEYRCPKASVGYIARDIQNALAAMKAGIDGMIDARVVPNDSKKYLRWGTFDLITRKEARGEGVRVVVRAL